MARPVWFPDGTRLFVEVGLNGDELTSSPHPQAKAQEAVLRVNGHPPFGTFTVKHTTMPGAQEKSPRRRRGLFIPSFTRPARTMSPESC